MVRRAHPTMKTSRTKLLKIALLTAALIFIGPRVWPMIQQAFTSSTALEIKPVLPPPGVKHLEKVEDLLFEMTNQARVAKGLAPLIKDEELREVARAYSDDMLLRGFFDHVTPDGVAFHKRIGKAYHHWVFDIGENIWHDDSYDPDKTRQLAKEIFADWMESKDHRENLLDPDYTHLGVGVSAQQHRIRATQEFVRRPRFFGFGGGG